MVAESVAEHFESASRVAVDDLSLDALLARMSSSERARWLVAIDRYVQSTLPQYVADAEDRLAIAQEAAGVGLYEINVTANVTIASPMFFKLFGIPYGNGVMTFAQWQAAIHPEDRESAQRGMMAGLACDITEHEYRVLRDGKVRWLHLRNRTRRNGKGWAVKAYGAAIDITDRKAAEAAVWHAAHHDALTALPNRLLFADKLTAMLAGAGPAATGLLLFDLDHLKQANDKHGHAAGDALLKGAAARLSAVADRAGGVAARLGGDEFAVAVPATSPPGLLRLGAAAVARMAEPLPFNGVTLDCGASAGAALAPLDATGADQLMRYADLALCTAKRRGRGRCLPFTPDLAGAFAAAA